MPESSLLIHADSEQCSDAFFLTGVRVPDPFLTLRVRGKVIAIVSALEFTRVKRDSKADEVWSLEEWSAKALARRTDGTTGPASPAEVAAEALRSLRVKRVKVPDTFPASTAFALVRAGFVVEPAGGPLLPERLVKSDAEADGVRAGNRLSVVGFKRAEAIFAETVIRGKKLLWQGRALTSEVLRQEIEIAILRAGGSARNTIVAGGDQACDPHHRGSGPLRPNELIIIDIFPQHVASGYHGDMTRTYLVGKPSEAQEKLVATVAEAQRRALAIVGPGVDGKKAHDAVVACFDAAGYVTRKVGDVNEGFFHGTGHGLGLDVHDGGRISRLPFTLREGHVMTIEPGLYYPGLGGCRIEDVVRITAKGYELLSKHPYRWVFPGMTAVNR